MVEKRGSIMSILRISFLIYFIFSFSNLEAKDFEVVPLELNEGCRPVSLNDKEVVLLSCTLGYMETRIEIWDNGVSHIVGSAGQGGHSPLAFNDNGEIVGGIGVNNATPFFFSEGAGMQTLTERGYLADVNSFGKAIINEQSYYGDFFLGVYDIRSRQKNLYDARELRCNSGITKIFGKSISEKGVIVGHYPDYQSCEGANAFAYNGSLKKLPNGEGVQARLVNINNWVVGTDAEQNSILWKGLNDQFPQVIADSPPLAINSRNQIIGKDWIWDGQLKMTRDISELRGFELIDNNDNESLLVSKENATGENEYFILRSVGTPLAGSNFPAAAINCLFSEEE